MPLQRARTIREVFSALLAEHLVLWPVLCDDDGPYITILPNSKNMREMEALAAILSDGDEAANFLSVSAG